MSRWSPVPTCVRLIEFRQEVEKDETEQIGPGEGVEQLDVTPILQLEHEDRQRTDDNAGEQEKIIHEAVKGALLRV